MSDISEHHTKQERKDGYSKKCWVDFLVARNTIGVDDFLEGCSEGVGLEVSGWFNAGLRR